MEVDGTDVSGSITIPNTGSWQMWTNVVVSGIPMTQGSHTLTIVMETNGVTINYIDISTP